MALSREAFFVRKVSAKKMFKENVCKRSIKVWILQKDALLYEN